MTLVRSFLAWCRRFVEPGPFDWIETDEDQA
jgi:hypothetical protein